MVSRLLLQLESKLSGRTPASTHEVRSSTLSAITSNEKNTVGFSLVNRKKVS